MGQKCGFEKFVPCCGPHLIVAAILALWTSPFSKQLLLLLLISLA